MKVLSVCVMLVASIGAPAFAATHYYAEGRFGRALNAQFGTLDAASRPAYAQPPLTVECWAKLRNASQPNILVSNGQRESSTHWELFTFSGNGHFSAALPGYSPELTVSERNIVDAAWHYVAMTFDGSTVRLFVDGAEAANQRVTKVRRKPATGGGLLIGRASTHADETGPSSDPAGCSGLIDDVRISRGIRNVAKVPQAAMRADAETLGLWSMDSGTDRNVPDLSTHANLARVVRRLALDDHELAGYKAGPSPMASQPVLIPLSTAAVLHPAEPASLSLDGEWQMVEAGNDAQRLKGSWDGAIPARVPGSVHTALTVAGKIPDPKFGLNDKIAHDKSFTAWWFRRDFDKPRGITGERLVFGGCAIRCTVWLNGTILGTHEGMFGGPEFNVANLLRGKNTLIVKIDAAPGKKELWENSDWRRTVVFNNVWGWHYSSIPALGIWRSVRIESTPPVRLLHSFVATMDAQNGVVDLNVDLQGRDARWSGRLLGTIEPDSFQGTALNFTYPISSITTEKRVHLRVRIPSPKLWWPNDIGDPNLYRLRVSFAPQNGEQADSKQTTFGIRTVEMFSQPDGPRPDQYNWNFVINGRPMFVKGSNWCTLDSSMDFSRKRYDRFLSLTAQQHVQLLRAWGSGMPETDDFYDLCDRKGIMVMQEWPTAWDSHNDQPYDMLEETVRLNTLRIRNHPSLVMYAGGNESPRPFGPAIDMMGRASIELDGTRMFHRGEPFGGSTHPYDTWWGDSHMDAHLYMTSVFLGEFGIASAPNIESVRRYLPDEEKDLWPAPPGGTFTHHTPVFNTASDMFKLTRMANYFTAGATMERYVEATQLAQATGLRHTLEHARTNWPRSAGALYYKINDNYPAVSWSTIDWYGAPKSSYYFLQDAFSPLRACAIFRSINVSGQDIAVPVFLLDDADALSGSSWDVVIRAYDSGLKMIKSETYSGSGSIDRVRQAGTFRLTSEQTKSSPLFTVVEIHRNKQLTHRSYYWSNYENNKDCLFNLPTTTLSMKVEGTNVTLTNTGSLPAVAARVLRPAHLDTFTADDNYFWLEPGESRQIVVSDSQGLTAGAWNAGTAEPGASRQPAKE